MAGWPPQHVGPAADRITQPWRAAIRMLRVRPDGGMTGCAGALRRWVFMQAGRPAWRDSSRMSEVASAITGIPRRTGGVCLGGGRIGRAKLWRDGSRRGWVAADLMPVVSAG